MASVRQAAPRLSWQAAILLGTLMLAQMIAAWFSVPYIDPIRDIDVAQRMLSAGFWPLKGPPLAHTVHMGPVWYYLVAAWLGLTGSIAMVAVIVAGLSALKYPLIYALVRQLHGPAAGLLAAALLALPGWHSFELMYLTHAALVETTLLMTALAWLALSRHPNPRRGFLLGLSAALALHAHPTAMILVVILPALWLTGHRWPMRPALLTSALLGFILPFVPWLAAEWLLPDSDLGRIGAYTGREISLSNLAHVPAVIRTLFFDGLRASMDTFVHRHAGLPVALAWLGFILAAWASVLARRQLFAWLGPLLVLTAAAGVVALLRTNIPFYMTFALYPLAAFLLARVLNAARSPLWQLGGLAAVIVSVAVQWGYVQTVSEGHIRLYAHRMHNTLSGPWQPSQRGPVMPVSGLGESGAWLCAQPEVRSHGNLVALLDTYQGIDAFQSCGRRTPILRSSCDRQRNHWLGLPASAWRQLSLAPARWLGKGTGIIEVSCQPATPHIARLRATRYLVVDNPEFRDNPIHRLEVRFNRQPVAPMIDYDKQWYLYSCGKCASGGWTVEIQAPNHAAINLLGFGGQAGDP